MRTALLVLLVGGCTQGPTLPRSTSTRPAPVADVAVVVDHSRIVVDGRTVARIERGPDGVDRVADDGLVEGSVPGLRSALKGAYSPGARVGLTLDRDVPAAVALPVMHAVMQSGFGSPWIHVQGPGGVPAGIGLTLPIRGSAAANPQTKVAAETGAWANPTLVLDADRGVRIQAFDHVYDGLLIPCDPDCSTGFPAIELNRVTRRLKLDHPRDRAIRVKPSPEATVQAMVTAMDASRDDTLTARGSRELFPTAVIDPRDAP